MNDRPTRVKIDIVDMLEFLGVNQVERDGKEVWFQCPFPGHKPGSGNRNASFRYDKSQWWTFNCFVCGNHGNAITFWALHQDMTYGMAKISLLERYGQNFIEPGEGDAFLEEINRLLGNADAVERPPAPIEESVQHEFAIDWPGVWHARSLAMPVPAAFTYMFDRGFTWDTLRAAEIGYDPISDMITIPYRDDAGRLVAFKGRAWNSDRRPKYRFLGNKPEREDRYTFATCDANHLVYGTHLLDRAGLPLILCEGELNCLAMKQKGWPNTVGLSGQFLHTRQAAIVMGLTDDVTLLFDEVEKAEQAASMMDGLIRVNIVPEHDGDPADSSAEEIASWLVDAYPSTVLD